VLGGLLLKEGTDLAVELVAGYPRRHQVRISMHYEGERGVHAPVLGHGEAESDEDGRKLEVEVDGGCVRGPEAGDR
jgi:hypothetical protein